MTKPSVERWGPFEPGQLVMYWMKRRKSSRQETGRWHGPAKVILQESQWAVWLSHSHRLFERAPESIRPASLRESLSWYDRTLRIKLRPLLHNPLCTSSTAQGGGGSFKKLETYRRGWLLWITDGRAKPLMDRKVIDVSSLSLSFSDYLPTYLPIYLPMYLSIYLSIYLSFYLSNYLSIYLSFICLSV